MAGVSSFGVVGRPSRSFVALTVLSGVVVLVAWGLSRGVWLPNLHNGLLALAFAGVGAYVARLRPGHRLGRLFLATGAVEAVMFQGRQIGHHGSGRAAVWWGWLGTWPVAGSLALATLAVLCFPDGRFPSRRWAPIAAAVVAVAGACAAVSALWPVEYASVGLGLDHPFAGRTPAAVDATWSAVAHPAYAAFQVLWVVAVVGRWRRATGVVRVQLACLASAALVSVVALGIGLAVSGTPRAGVLAAALAPVAAGWAVVHGRRIAAYSALTWLSRAAGPVDRLPDGLAEAAALGLHAPSAVVWVGDGELHAIGVWPPTEADVEPMTVDALLRSPSWTSRTVTLDGRLLGAVSVMRPVVDELTAAEARLFDDLAAQARFVIEHVGLADLVGRPPRAPDLDLLSPREREVLGLMARGMSNAAICRELHLSVKTVEPVVSSIFGKLGLPADSASNRRVLAVLAYLRA